MAETGSPRYVAIITDGNGRWARQRGMPVQAGHRAGAENVRARLRDAAELGIRELTCTPSRPRTGHAPPEEVRGLIDLLAEYIDRVTPELHAQGVQLRFIGDRGLPVPTRLVDRMDWAEQLTAKKHSPSQPSSGPLTGRSAHRG